MKNDRPSSTAWLIAAGIAYLGDDPAVNGLIPAGAVDACGSFVRACSSRGAAFLRALKVPVVRFLIRMLEWWALPGVLLHYVLRKRFLERIVRTSLKEGFQQVVVLGGGFDTLALRLQSEFPDVTFMEVDHPATQEPKAIASRSAIAPGTNLNFLPVDFTKQDWEEKLLEARSFDRNASTLFVMEGVLVYLHLEQVRRVFRFIRRHSGPRSRLAFTFMEPLSSGRIDFRHCNPAVSLWLRLKSEPFRWGIDRRKLPNFLEREGFRLLEIGTPELLRRLYLAPSTLNGRPLAEGECIGVADRS
jgi:methyltransferase (TIGR00027 family)